MKRKANKKETIPVNQNLIDIYRIDMVPNKKAITINYVAKGEEQIDNIMDVLATKYLIKDRKDLLAEIYTCNPTSKYLYKYNKPPIFRIEVSWVPTKIKKNPIINIVMFAQYDAKSVKTIKELTTKQHTAKFTLLIVDKYKNSILNNEVEPSNKLTDYINNVIIYTESPEFISIADKIIEKEKTIIRQKNKIEYKIPTIDSNINDWK
jgi:hypothetical protein